MSTAEFIQTNGLKAVAAWMEVDDGTVYLCMDLDNGKTIEVELEGPAFHGINDSIQHGPKVVR